MSLGHLGSCIAPHPHPASSDHRVMTGYRRIGVNLVIGVLSRNGNGGDAPIRSQIWSKMRKWGSRPHDYWISPPASGHIRSLFDAYGLLTLAKAEGNGFGGISGGIDKIHIGIHLLKSVV